MDKKIFSIFIIILLLSIFFNIIIYLNYIYHLEIHKKYDIVYHRNLGVMCGYLSSMESILTEVIDKNYLTYDLP